MSQNKANVLIAGVTGFIGRNLREYLSAFCSDKYSLFSPSHSELELLDSEKVQSYISGNSIDIIVNCANVGGSRKTNYDIGITDIVSKNLGIFFNLIHCLDKVKRIIHLGSGAEYDYRYYKPRMKEDYFDLHIPQDAYGFSKYVCSKFIMNSQKIINLRLFGVFGKYEDYRYKFISNSIVKNLLGLPIIINQNVNFDYLYVDDLVKIIALFANIDTQFKHRFYNVLTGRTIDLMAIAEQINKIAKKSFQIAVKHQGLNTEYSGDNTRLLEEFTAFRFTPFNKALEELYCWYGDNLKTIDKEEIVRDEYIKYCRTKVYSGSKKK